jgi:hypothetical protein
MIKNAISRLTHLCGEMPIKLRAIDNEKFQHKPSAEKWSKKEILGHLCDSAANNHQRFIRARYIDTPHIVYDQNHWVSLTNYQSVSTDLLVDHWTTYNLLIIHICSQINDHDLERTCETSNGNIYTLDYLFNDYVDHMEHHLNQITNQ